MWYAIWNHFLGVEPGERRPKVLPLTENRDPREPRLKRLETQPLVEGVSAVDGPSPFGVVVLAVEIVRDGTPRAARPAVRARNSCHCSVVAFLGAAMLAVRAQFLEIARAVHGREP